MSADTDPDVSIQRAARGWLPDDAALCAWVRAALPADHCADDERADDDCRYELCLRLVEAEESAALNSRYRNRPGPTNVLSFGCDVDAPGWRLRGDLVICAPVVAAEAREQGKAEAAHWAHMVVHGVLHLLGYDHIGEHEARLMESEERAILARLGFADPYRMADIAPDIVTTTDPNE